MKVIPQLAPKIHLLCILRSLLLSPLLALLLLQSLMIEITSIFSLLPKFTQSSQQALQFPVFCLFSCIWRHLYYSIWLHLYNYDKEVLPDKFTYIERWRVSWRWCARSSKQSPSKLLDPFTCLLNSALQVIIISPFALCTFLQTQTLPISIFLLISSIHFPKVMNCLLLSVTSTSLTFVGSRSTLLSNLFCDYVWV